MQCRGAGAAPFLTGSSFIVDCQSCIGSVYLGLVHSFVHWFSLSWIGSAHLTVDGSFYLGLVQSVVDRFSLS